MCERFSVYSIHTYLFASRSRQRNARNIVVKKIFEYKKSYTFFLRFPLRRSTISKWHAFVFDAYYTFNCDTMKNSLALQCQRYRRGRKHNSVIQWFKWKPLTRIREWRVCAGKSVQNICETDECRYIRHKCCYNLYSRQPLNVYTYLL